TFGEAGQYLVPSRMAAPRFDLPALTTLPAAIEGQVLGYNPLADAMPQPLEGATVVAMPALAVYTREIITTQTGPDGRFRLDISADTPYRVVAWADGYETMYFQNARDYASATLVDVTPGGTTSNIDFALPEILPGHDTGSITGVVLKRLSEDCTRPDPTGTNSDSCFVPAPGALVIVSSAFPTLAEVEYQTYTDEQGRFRVDGLLGDPDGYFAYYVAAQNENGELFYYPGGVSFQEAQPLPVYPGQVSDTGPIILNGKPSGGEGFIAGHVTDLENQPIDHALVRVYVDPDSPWGYVAQTFSGTDGSFYVGGLPQGASVILSAEANGYVPAYYPHAYQWTLAERVLVGGPNTRMAPLDMKLRPAATGGPFIQAGLVVVKPDSVVSDSGWVDPAPAGRKI
ncbi:MAG TPA: carboxypeptidase-like regulatory domain-containing protein, partial [Candidatus Eisenbacteria bacterium]|nr:carboxypeptidase-like regulatory domain-containing protein [Candidatus Eisenbacteria bacterium]